MTISEGGKNQGEYSMFRETKQRVQEKKSHLQKYIKKKNN